MLENDFPQKDEGGQNPRFLIIGQIRKPHGVRGELRLSCHTDLPERFDWLERVYLSRQAEDDNPQSAEIDSVRYGDQDIFLKLKGYDTRTSVEALRQYWVKIPIAEAIPLDEDEYYSYELINLDVFTAEGEFLGKIHSIIETGANDVWVVRKEDSAEKLIPNIPDVVQEIDLTAKRATITVLPGLFDWPHALLKKQDFLPQKAKKVLWKIDRARMTFQSVERHSLMTFR